ncbi:MULTISPECIES: type IX secretion system outer membrane channel protein PorV [Emticicia]|uniref:type IX secretion system outer membrane channel protein PorV n=1 Tax=Emticicia TaxID=312278 RepID=UPI0007D89C11|nr:MULTISPECIES: type IX secretion system outer membrane channel protein PorV [Emticicia]
MKNLKMIGLLLLTSLKSIAQAYTPVNTNRILVGAFPFQNFTYDARSASLGEAGIAISPDANSALMNPAKLVFLKQDSTQKSKNIGVSLHYTPYYRNLIQGMNLFGGNLFQVKEKKAYGLTVKYFDAGNVAIYGDNREFIKSFQSKEFSINGFYSLKVRQNNSISIGLKYIYSNLSAHSTTQNVSTKPVNAIAGDLYFYHNGRNTKKHWLNYGASLTNIGGKVSYGDYKQRTFQPTLLKLGAAQNFILGKKQNVLMFTVDANKLLLPTPSIRNAQNEVIAGRNEENITGIGTIFQSWGTAPDGLRETMREITFSFGTEFQYRNFLAIRAGYYTQNRLKGDLHYFTLGLGGKLKNFGLDLSYLLPNKKNQILSNTFRVSLNYYLFK